MGVTAYPYGVSSFGVPVLPGPTSRFYGWWGRTSWFVDFSNGSDSNTGKEPTRAVKYLATAITKAAAGDVIYIRPASVASTDTDPAFATPETATNWNIPRTKYNLALIGAGPQVGPGQIWMTYIRGHASVTGAALGDATLTVRAPFCTVENLAIHRGGSTRALVEFYGDGTSAANAFGSAAYNCEFRLGNASMTAGLYVLDSWYCGAYRCHFQRNNPRAIYFRGIQTTATGNYVIGNLFEGGTTVMTAFVRIQGVPDYTYILDNVFAPGTPALSGGASNKYIHNDNHTTYGIISGNKFGADLSTLADGITAGTNVTCVGNWDTTANLVV